MRHHQFASAAGEVFPNPSRAAFFFFVPVLNFHPPNLFSAFSPQQAMLVNGYVNFASLCVKSNTAQTETNLRVEKRKIYYTAVCIVVA